jgi:hypothetical protein
MKSKKEKKLVQHNNQTENSQMNILFQLRLQNIKIGHRANKNVTKRM